MRAEFAIGITTRDRWSELERTLEAVEAYGLSHCETVVMDDGSATEIPAALEERFPWVRFQRSPKSLGYIAQRNRLARQLTAPLYLSLDDDSSPIQGDIAPAAEWLASHPDVVALAFRVAEGDGLPAEPASPDATPVRFYIGCAHLLKRDEFVRLGGYREELESYCEEFEFCVRAWGQQRAVMSWPSVVFRHQVTPTGRDLERINRLLTRNDLWIATWHYPWTLVVLSFFNCLPRQFRFAAHRRHWRAVFRGFISALRTLPQTLERRTPQPWSRHVAWRSLPHATTLVERAQEH